MRYWTFRNTHGLWSIRFHAGRWRAYLDDDDLGPYPSPQSALDDLVGGHTFATPTGLDTTVCGLPDELADWTPQGGQ